MNDDNDYKDAVEEYPEQQQPPEENGVVSGGLCNNEEIKCALKLMHRIFLFSPPDWSKCDKPVSGRTVCKVVGQRFHLIGYYGATVSSLWGYT